MEVGVIPLAITLYFTLHAQPDFNHPEGHTIVEIAASDGCKATVYNLAFDANNTAEIIVPTDANAFCTLAGRRFTVVRESDDGPFDVTEE